METDKEPIEPKRTASKKKAPSQLVKRMNKAAEKIVEQQAQAEEATSAHGAAAKALQQKHRNLAKEEKASKQANTVWYVACPDPTCGGPGIWIFEQPTGPLRNDQWSSSYKPLGMPWPAKDVPCQCCYDEGRRTFLPMFHQEGVPVVNPRHLRSIMRAEFEELLDVGGAQ
jgi:hypothetical protein